MAKPEGGAGQRVRVAVVAPYPALRAGLRALLAEDERLEVVAEAARARDLAPELSGAADVLVLDLDADGAWSAVSEAATLPQAPGLVLLGPFDTAESESRLFELLGERAWAYLLKDAGAAELIGAIGAVAQGLVVLQPPLARRLLEAPARAASLIDVEGHDALTAREHEVLQLVAEGLPNKTIALRLGISEHTVKFHITSILAKLGAASRTEAVRIGARRGLIVL